MAKTRGFQLSRLTIQHFDFLLGLHESGMLSEKGICEEAEAGLSGMPKEAERVIYPVNLEIVGLVSQHYRSGRKKIAIYRDADGQRYVAADFLEEK